MARAFTLIELLTVVAIIAILAGMLLPAVSAVKNAADAAVCSGSMRQLGMSVSAYADQYDGFYMPMNVGVNGSIPWMELAHEFIEPDTHLGTQAGLSLISRKGPIWGCPTWRRLPAFATFGNWSTGYGINAYPWKDGSAANNLRWTNLDPASATPGERIALGRIVRATARVAFGDTTNWFLNGTAALMDARHRQLVQLAYIDGHVGTATVTAACTAISNP